MDPTRFDFIGTGNPNGIITAHVDQTYLDNSATPVMYVKQSGNGTNTGWMSLGVAGGSGGGTSTFTYTGSGSPEGVQSASAGQSYEDTTDGAIYFKGGESFYTADTGWIAAGGILPNLGSKLFTPPRGILFDTNNDFLVLLTEGNFGSTAISDAYAFAPGGTQNGLWLWTGSADGSQSIRFFLGSTSQYKWIFDKDGTSTFPDAINTGHSKTSGSLSTVTLTSGTAAQIDAMHDRHLVVPTTTAGTVKVELSPDGTTYSTLYTRTTLATDAISVDVPGGWRVRLTATTSTLGTATFY